MLSNGDCSVPTSVIHCCTSSTVDRDSIQNIPNEIEKFPENYWFTAAKTKKFLVACVVNGSWLTRTQ